MAMEAQKSVLMICGDYMEDYEAIVPFFVLQSLGIVVHCVLPGKLSGDTILTAVHDYQGFELMNQTKCTAFPSIKLAICLAGGLWVDPDPFEICVVDRNILSAVGWPAHAELVGILLESIGAQVHGPGNQAVLFLIADFVEDYEINVPFRALGALGCKVDVVCPTKKKGEWCATTIHNFDSGCGSVCAERRGHNFVTTLDWAHVDADAYDCLVIPGGRSPELLVGNESVVSFAKKFVEKGKVVSGIGHGLLVLVAAGILRGKQCTSNDEMKVMVALGGGEGYLLLGDGLHCHSSSQTSSTCLTSMLLSNSMF